MKAISRHYCEVIQALFGVVFGVRKKLLIGVSDGEWGMVIQFMYEGMPGFVICLGLGSVPLRFLVLII